MKESRLSELFKLYYAGKASETESEELDRLIDNSPENELEALLEEVYEAQEFNQNFFLPSIQEKMMNRIMAAESVDDKVFNIREGRRRVLKIAAAAAVFLLVSLSLFLVLGDRNNSHVAVLSPKEENKIQDVGPGGDKAILTLADGTKIVLDSTNKGSVADQAGIKVINLEGQLAYQGDAETNEVLYNTVTTPRGGQYQLILADGSKVWLNAASSLRFPTAFVGEERVVELMGEGYFEVAKSNNLNGKKQPFKVKIHSTTGPVELEVLGTHFNINSYKNESDLRVTLLEGRVKVSKEDRHLFLNPGQQALLKAGEENFKVEFDVDLDEVVAWKNGQFLFNSVHLDYIMRQAERWYNVDLVYEGQINETFSGTMPRTENISQLLKIIEATDKVDFTIHERKIIIKAK
jgi:transmembrane sensor